MELPEPRPGMVIRYSFLWRRDADHGREDSGKGRPCAIVMTVAREGGRIIATVVPITHRPPDSSAEAVELPPDVKSRLGLDAERSWILTHELNAFFWPGPDIQTIEDVDDRTFAYGRLPGALYQRVLQAILKHQRAGRLRPVVRTE
jgi:hypothetical protein